MANTPLDTLFPLLAPHVPGAPEATMREHLAAAAAVFIGETHLWRQALFPETTTPGVADYPLIEDAVVESVLWVVLDGIPLAPTDPRLLNKALLTQVGRPLRYWLRSDTEIVLHPTPDAEYEFSGEVALKPSRTATMIPDWIYETWADALVDGAVWRLASIPGKPWTAMDLAMMRKQRFDRAMVNAKARDLRQVELHVQMRAF